MNEYIDTKGIELLNANQTSSQATFLIDASSSSSSTEAGSSKKIQSDCDAQLILILPFRQAVKIHSIKLTAPEGTRFHPFYHVAKDAQWYDIGDGPRDIKLFINQSSLGFEAADSDQPTQSRSLLSHQIVKKERRSIVAIGLTLTKEQLKGESEAVALRYVKFQSVHSLAIFVRDNQADSEVTSLSSVKIYGTPVATTNVDNLKKMDHDH